MTVRKLWDILSRRGVRGTIFRLRVLLADRWFDLRYGVETCGITPLENLSIFSDSKSGGFRYEPTRVLPVRKFFKAIRSELPVPTALVDIGCGKGRLLLIAAECGFARATGVEFASELCEIARANCETFGTNHTSTTQLSVVEGDAVTYAVRCDDNVFYFFNPFGLTVLAKVLDNIVLSLHRYPRKILLGFYNTDPTPLMRQYPELLHLRDVDLHGYCVRVFVGG